MPQSPYPPKTENEGDALDLNALLAKEQGAVMRAEAATEIEGRDEQRELAREARVLIDSTPFPARSPHDFEATTPREQRALEFGEFEALQERVTAMDEALANGLAEGLVSLKSFQHRSRVIRQLRQRLR